MASCLTSGQYGFLNYEAEEGKKLFFHQTEVKDNTHLSPGDEVEFVIITNQKTGKSSACNISRMM
jgi:cold shock CspA family protein